MLNDSSIFTLECTVCNFNTTNKISIMAISANKKFWTEFIEIYHSLPSLWNTKDEDYNNRESRSFAWNKLVEKLQEVEPDANQDSVKRKINTFRSNFNREVRKIRLTQKELSTEVYSPTLWYFDQLSFLLNQEKRNNNGVSIGEPYDEEMTLMGIIAAKKELTENETTMYAESVSQENIAESDTNSQYEKLIKNNNRDIVSEPERNPLTEYTSIIEVPQKETTESITPRVFTLQENHNRSGNVEKRSQTQNVSTSRTVRMKRSKMRLKSQEPYGSRNVKSDLSSSIFTDEAAIYGQAWACGFRMLSPQQKLFAKKAIDEIIILGQLKALKLNTVPTNVSLLQEHSDEG